MPSGGGFDLYFKDGDVGQTGYDFCDQAFPCQSGKTYHRGFGEAGSQQGPYAYSFVDATGIAQTFKAGTAQIGQPVYATYTFP